MTLAQALLICSTFGYTFWQFLKFRAKALEWMRLFKDVIDLQGQKIMDLQVKVTRLETRIERQEASDDL